MFRIVVLDEGLENDKEKRRRTNGGEEKLNVKKLYSAPRRRKRRYATCAILFGKAVGIFLHLILMGPFEPRCRTFAAFMRFHCCALCVSLASVRPGLHATPSHELVAKRVVIPVHRTNVFFLFTIPIITTSNRRWLHNIILYYCLVLSQNRLRSKVG